MPKLIIQNAIMGRNNCPPFSSRNQLAINLVFFCGICACLNTGIICKCLLDVILHPEKQQNYFDTVIWNRFHSMHEQTQMQWFDHPFSFIVKLISVSCFLNFHLLKGSVDIQGRNCKQNLCLHKWEPFIIQFPSWVWW